MLNRVIRLAKPGYGGSLPRLEIGGVLYSRMFEIGDMVDRTLGDTGEKKGRPPIGYHVMTLYREKNPDTCIKVERYQAKNWGWYVPTVAERDAEEFAMNPDYRMMARTRMISWQTRSIERKATREMVVDQTQAIEPAAQSKVIRLVPTGVTWMDNFNRMFRGYHLQLPESQVATLHGPDHFVRISDLVGATGRTNPKLGTMVRTEFWNKVIYALPVQRSSRAVHFLHHSAIPDCLKFIERQARLKKERIVQLRNLLGVAA